MKNFFPRGAVKRAQELLEKDRRFSATGNVTEEARKLLDVLEIEETEDRLKRFEKLVLCYQIRMEKEKVRVEEMAFKMCFGYYQPGGGFQEIFNTYGDLPGFRG